MTALSVLASCSRETRMNVPNDPRAADRAAMVATIRRYGVTDSQVLAAMGKVPRHEYVPEAFRHSFNLYGDHPGPIGHGQTISQPFIVAYMTEKMAPQPGEKVLEIGTGSGYQAAVLAELGLDVFTIEIIPELAEHARQALARTGYPRVRVLAGDGYQGWPEHAPYNIILVTCAPDDVPPALVAQLAEHGRMIVPVGVDVQRLVILKKSGGEIRMTDDLPVRFVPMVHGENESAP